MGLGILLGDLTCALLLIELGADGSFLLRLTAEESGLVLQGS